MVNDRSPNNHDFGAGFACTCTCTINENISEYKLKTKKETSGHLNVHD